MPSGKVTITKDHIADEVGSSEFTIDILTRGNDPPQATLSANSDFPPVKDFYARTKTVQNQKCIRLNVRFHSNIPNNASSIVVNLFQEDAQEFTLPHPQ